MRKLIMIIIVVLSASVSGLAFSGPAVAATVGPAVAAGPAALQLTITPLSSGPGVPGVLMSVTLTCGPAGGTHPYPEQACADIAAANGSIAAVPPRAGLGCLALWQPVEISASGIWGGKVVAFKETQANVGCARISHGYVFNLEK